MVEEGNRYGTLSNTTIQTPQKCSREAGVGTGAVIRIYVSAEPNEIFTAPQHWLQGELATLQ